MRPSPPSPTAVWTLCLRFPQAWGNYKPEQLAPSQELIHSFVKESIFKICWLGCPLPSLLLPTECKLCLLGSPRAWGRLRWGQGGA